MTSIRALHVMNEELREYFFTCRSMGLGLIFAVTMMYSLKVLGQVWPTLMGALGSPILFARNPG